MSEPKQEREEADEDSVGLDAIATAVEDADVVIGLADVDPEPLSTVGEAIDPDATKDAHTEGPERRERLPVRGKNLP